MIREKWTNLRRIARSIIRAVGRRIDLAVEYMEETQQTAAWEEK